MSKIEINQEHNGYTYMGCAQGRFETRDGTKRPYYNIYVVCPVSTYSSEDYQAFGYKAEKKSCTSADVWNGLVPGDRVRLYFDDKQRVMMAELVE